MRHTSGRAMSFALTDDLQNIDVFSRVRKIEVGLDLLDQVFVEFRFHLQFFEFLDPT